MEQKNDEFILKCPYRRVITERVKYTYTYSEDNSENEDLVRDKVLNQTVEEFGDCYKNACPFYNDMSRTCYKN